MIDHYKSPKPVAYWLLAGVFMLIIQIALGGITRLTGSGLSITEWDVITGTLPPLNEHQWFIEFSKYKQTSQYQLLNFDFTMSDFKFIFFWEWFHRFWARLLGVVFLIGFITFLAQRRIKPEMVVPFVILFLLGALQGAIGWIMVASGLTGDAIYVKPTRLALHFIFAMLLVAYTFWFALKLIIKPNKRAYDSSLKKFNIILLIILAVQLIYGALMAGHKAAPTAPTWPDINGYFIPTHLTSHKPFLINFIDNKIFIHFIHRNLAYILAIALLLFYITIKRKLPASTIAKSGIIIPALVFLQIALGIFTVLSSTVLSPASFGRFEWMAQLHQITGMFLMLALVYSLYLLSAQKT